MTNKDKLRSLTLGAKSEFARKTVTVAGAEFAVRQPSLKERGRFREAAMKINKDGADFDIYEFQIQAVIGLTEDPETKEPVFTAADRDSFDNCPAGGWFDELAKVASELCNISDDKAKKD